MGSDAHVDPEALRSGRLSVTLVAGSEVGRGVLALALDHPISLHAGLRGGTCRNAWTGSEK
jgi:hypothetical protein